MAALSNRILAAIFVLDLAIVWIGLVFEFLPKEEEYKIIFDVGLATTAFFTMAIGVFLAGWCFPDEIGHRKIYLVLSKPVSRGEFFTGKLIGLLGTSLLATAAMGALIMGIVFFKFKLSPEPVLLALYMNVLELLVIVSIALFCSVWTSGRAAVILTILFYFLGHSSSTLFLKGAQSSFLPIQWATKISYVILPNLELFNVRQVVTHGMQMPWTLIVFATLYALAYAGWVLCLTYRLFLRKEI